MEEFSVHQWIPPTKASNAELCWFLSSATEQTEQPRQSLFDRPSRSLWRHCNELIRKDYVLRRNGIFMFADTCDQPFMVLNLVAKSLIDYPGQYSSDISLLDSV